MSKAELQHKLGLIKIHKRGLDHLGDTNAAMGGFTPPYIVMDIEKRQEEVKKLFADTIELLKKNNDFKISTQLSAQLDGFKDLEIGGNTISDFIRLIELILKDPSGKTAERDIHHGNVSSITIINSQNIVIDSNLSSDDLQIGDKTELPPAITQIEKQVNIRENHGNFLPGNSIVEEQAVFNDGHALLIGVGGDLPATVNDAQALADLLSDPRIAAYPASQVHLLTETKATRVGILDALDQIIEQTNTNPEATVFIYYAGHGGRFRQNSDEDNTYYLIPHDFDNQNREKTMVSGREFAARIDHIKSKKLFVILDCCHAQGIMARTLDTRHQFHPSGTSLISMLKMGGGRVTIASSEDGEVSWETNQHGLFTSTLLEALKGCNSQGTNGLVHVADVLQYLLIVVPERSKKFPKPQNPIISRVENLNSKFFLCRYNPLMAEQSRSSITLLSEVRKKLEEPSHQTIHNYKNVQNQVNININKGPINL